MVEGVDRLGRFGRFSLVISHEFQTAKQCFSYLAEEAAKGNPQLVTKHGKPYVVIAKAADWCDKKVSEKPLWEVLRSCPTDLTALNPWSPKQR